MATAPKKGGATPDDIMTAAAMKPLLLLSKREPVNCALGLTADKAGVLLLHKKMKPKKVLSELRNEAKKVKLDLENATLRFGTAEVDAEVDSSLVLFRINKEVPGMVGPKLREHLKQAGISKVEFIVDPSLEEDVDEDGPEAPEPEPARTESEPDWQGLMGELVLLAKEIGTAGAGNPARQQVLVKLAAAANGSLKAQQDFAAASAAVEALRDALHDVAPGGSGEGDDPLDLNNRMAAAAKQLNALKAANDPAFPSLLALLGPANTAMKAKSPDAGSAMDALESALGRAISAARGRAAGAGNTGKVAYAKLLLRWHDAQKRVDENLKALGQALLADPEVQDDPDFDVIQQGVADLAYLVPELGRQAGRRAGRCARPGGRHEDAARRGPGDHQGISGPDRGGDRAAGAGATLGQHAGREDRAVHRIRRCAERVGGRVEQGRLTPGRNRVATPPPRMSGPQRTKTA